MTERHKNRMPERPRRWLDFLVAGVLFGLLAGTWALASPMTAIPDEPPHAIRAAAVVRGQAVMPISEAHPSESVAIVPRYIAHVTALRCFAFDESKDASCQPPLSGDLDELVETRTSAGPNSPLYYAIIGWPTLFLSGMPALYAMRAVNVVVCAALVGFLFMSVRQMRPNQAILVPAVVSLTPMVLFLAGSMNPNAVEALAAGALFVTLILTFTTPSPGRLLWERGAIAVVSAMLLVNTRSISLLWLAIVVFAAIALGERAILAPLFRRRAAWVTVAASGAAAAAAVAWYLLPKPSGDAVELAGKGQSFQDGFFSMLDATFDFGPGWIGLFGWLDRPAPDFTYIVWTIAIGMVILAGLALARGAHLAVVCSLAALAVLIPPVVQGVLVTEFGYIWQGRYMLAVYTCLLLACGLAIQRFAPFSLAARRVSTLLVAFLAVAHVASFVSVLRRYVVGAGPWGEMITDPSWQPPLGWLPLTVIFTLGIAVTAVVVTKTMDSRPQSHSVSSLTV